MTVRVPNSFFSAHSNGLPKTDLQRCEDEPIRIPGSIQRHGFLLLLDSLDGHIVGASENTRDFLDIPSELVLGATVDSIFGREVLDALLALAQAGERPKAVTYLGAFPMREKLYTVVTHHSGNQRIVEFELLDRLVSPDMTNQIFSNFVGLLSQLRSEQELCDALTRQVRDLTHFNRIMLYRFDELGNGTVLSEENDGTLPSYLDLRFPASDIPQQARELYILNTVRIIPDANYLPSPLQAATSLQRTHKKTSSRTSIVGSIAKLDLSSALLRSVSPIHLEYMRNMGTLSSMSISIVCEGKLWGLVSGHHAEPHTVPYLVRSACDLLTKLVSTQLNSIRSSANLTKMLHFHGVQREVLTQMAADNNYLKAMADQMEAIMQIVDAEGAALVIDGHYQTIGNTPNESSIRKLAEWLDETHDMEVFDSRHLSREIAWAIDFAEVASGLLAIKISYVRQSYLMWFRPEVRRTVHWAGELTSAEDKALTLRPRTSFATWKEQVSGTSIRWSEMEIESAKDFRNAVMTIKLKRAEEAIQLGEARFLQLTNALPHPVWNADDEGNLTYVNQRWLDQGLRTQVRWYEQEAIVKEDQTRCAQIWKKAVALGTTFELEVRFCPEPKKIERWNLVRAIPFLRSNGTRAGWIGTCTDLTDRRQRESAVRMTEKLALTGRMTSVIAHEINNPLASITNLLYLLSSHVKDDKDASAYIGQAESELQRISGITKQTLRWARQDLEKPRYGSTRDLIDDVLRIYAGKIRNKEVIVHFESEHDVRVYGTFGQISQVVANLLSNAVQAVAVGGHIWISYAAFLDAVEFTIRDNGQGMSEETQRNLFQPFYSTKGDLGNGLGLYISHEIIERHRGTIIVESKFGKGTEIKVRLPTLPGNAGHLVN